MEIMNQNYSSIEITFSNLAAWGSLVNLLLLPKIVIRRKLIVTENCYQDNRCYIIKRMPRTLVDVTVKIKSH